jgi:two-component system, NarL family, nitrate/nitrite response regulator NarL
VRAGIPTIVIDGSELFRAGLKHILVRTPFRVKLAKASLANLSAQRKFKAEEKVLLIVSLGRPTVSDIAELSQLKQHNPQFRILVLSNSPSLEECLTMIEAGAAAYLQRSDLTPPVLVNALHLIYTDKAVIPQEFIRCIKLAAPSGGQVPTGNGDQATGNNSKPLNGESQSISIPSRLSAIPSRLSAREQEILEYLTKGASNKLIARGLHVAEATVKVHVKALLRKINVSNRTQAAMWAMTNLNNVQHLAVASDFPSGVGN